jgi:predicted AlkP superfamily phosphohydrolase/phosphomutase/tetratricopeptide (TPR) repeat protein
MKKKAKVLLIGWDSADWKIIDRLMEGGMMPAMKKLVDGGVRGRFATLDPPLSPMLWTTMATGMRPYKHGVIGFVENDGKGGVRPISSYGRKVNAFWNIFTKEGLKSNVVGWWPSNPVENINGVMVSDRFQQERKNSKVVDLAEWEIPPGTIHPESITDQISDLRIHPSEITGNLIMPFVPRAVERNEKEDPRLSVIGRFLAHSASLHAVTTDLMETTEWDITAVYHDALDHFSHAFMKYHPPRMEGLDEEMFEFFKDVVTGAYVYHDMMLERLLNLVDDDTTVIVVSDHGFHSDHLRPRFVPQVPSGPAVEHAPYGIFVARGPGIKKGESIHGARVLDLTPTLLAIFDLPVGRDMDGKPLVSIFDHPREIKYIDSWENDTRFGGEIVIKENELKTDNEAALQQLIDLGYIDETLVPDGADADEGKKKKLRDVVRENSFYLAKSMVGGGELDDALEILLEIEDRDKPDFRYLIEIVNISIKTKRFALAHEYVHYIRTNDLMNPDYLNVLEAQVRIGQNDAAGAYELLSKAADDFSDSTQVLLDFGKLLLTLWETKRARKAFEKILELDPQNPYAFHGLGLSYLREERFEEALDNFLNAVDSLFHYPLAHLHLGETLALMKDYENAIHSFKIVESIAPRYIRTYRWLIDMYSITGNDALVAHYKEKLSGTQLGQKIIVTGLPGEKLKKVLEHIEGDLKIHPYNSDFLDFKVDVSKKGWISEIEERVLFVPIAFLPALPQNYSYRILYVQQDPNEVMEFILSKERIRKGSISPQLLTQLQEREKTVRIWIDQNADLDILYVNNIEDLKNEVLKKFIFVDDAVKNI